MPGNEFRQRFHIETLDREYKSLELTALKLHVGRISLAANRTSQGVSSKSPLREVACKAWFGSLNESLDGLAEANVVAIQILGAELPASVWLVAQSVINLGTSANKFRV